MCPPCFLGISTDPRCLQELERKVPVSVSLVILQNSSLGLLTRCLFQGSTLPFPNSCRLYIIHPAYSLSLLYSYLSPSRLQFVYVFDVVHTPCITFRSLPFPFILALEVFLFETVAPSHRYPGSILKLEAVRWGHRGPPIALFLLE